MEINNFIYSPTKLSAGVCNHILLIDNTIKNPTLFYDAVNSNTFPIIYSPLSPKNELLSILRTHFVNINIDRIGIVFSNETREVNKFLDGEPFFINGDGDGDGPFSYSENIEFILTIIKEFSVKNIDYLGCNTLKSIKWKQYYSILTNETGVMVGASDDYTGNLKYGGDWIMENTNQDVKLVYFTDDIENYQQLLGGLYYSTILIKNDDSLWVTGDNTWGTLGVGDYTERLQLTNVDISGTNSIPKYISCGLYHTIMLMEDDTIWGTGYNGNGQLGVGDLIDRTIFTKMDLSGTNTIPKKIYAYDEHSMILMEDDTLWGIGSNNNGQLGLGDNIERNLLTGIDLSNVNSIPILLSSRSFSSTIVLMEDNTIWGTGLNSDGQLGVSDYSNRNVFTKMDLSGINKIPIYISSGSYHNLVLMSDNTIWGTGFNGAGQLGLGDNSSRNKLTRISFSETNLIPKSIQCSFLSSVILMSDNTIWGAGANDNGQLGVGDYSNRNVFTKMNLLGIVPLIITDICVGSIHTVVFMNDNTIWVTGGNSVADNVSIIGGQLGEGVILKTNILFPMVNGNNVKYLPGIEDELVPGTDEEILPGENQYTIDALSNTYGLLIKNDITNGYDRVYTWGRNDFQQLGNGLLPINTYIPILASNILSILNLTYIRVLQVSSLYYEGGYMLIEEIQTKKRYLYGWGKVILGYGTSFTIAPTPLRFNMTNTNIIQVVCSDSSVYILADLTPEKRVIYSIGSNTYGQLGIGSQVDVFIPTVYISISDKIIQVASGKHHMIAILGINGTYQLYSCGRNNMGQLGLTGNLGVRTTQRRVVNIQGNIIQVACGDFFSMAVVELTPKNRVLYSWGTNNNFQLGLVSNSGLIQTPQLVPDIQGDIIQIACSGDFSLALMELEPGVRYIYFWGFKFNGKMVLLDETGLDFFIGNIIQIYCFENLGYALLADGETYCWTFNIYDYSISELIPVNNKLFYFSGENVISLESYFGIDFLYEDPCDKLIPMCRKMSMMSIYKPVVTGGNNPKITEKQRYSNLVNRFKR